MTLQISARGLIWRLARWFPDELVMPTGAVRSVLMLSITPAHSARPRKLSGSSEPSLYLRCTVLRKSPEEQPSAGPEGI